AGATLYVTLEPCNHTGKTPPCTHAIIESGVSRVVIGMKDPNPLVNGTGIAFLKSYGVNVACGVLERECEEINVSFIKHIATGLPWVIMKGGVSLDGRLNYQKGESGWITGQESVLEAHKLRDRVDAILVGSQTIAIDNPSLTTRLPQGRTKDPVRIIVDSQLSTPLSANVYHLDSLAPTWVFHSEEVSSSKIRDFQAQGIRLFPTPGESGGLNLLEILKTLGREGLCSVMVEGGAKMHGALLNAHLFDYAHLFYAPLFAGAQGVCLTEGFYVQDRHNAPKLVSVHYKRFGDNMLISGRIIYSN
ncbi:MAG: bifunctional diaminohydroxyphosphoribosylaminopyrimidine deaminase/5-amino-6-(5-phosphoribosylamino)uracil reductase RibD, partial [Proteobacteria bacterium]|nr:bifunctional diaminohydroxyphosphoribosylaminopyrimidine deaminase/5-amino-6-(5-phosphoribosylamino)uracil reductase RibD [Pseudomonadota bacterium]